MACNVNWLCAIAILLLASTVQSQAQNSAGNKNTAKPPPATNDRKYFIYVCVCVRECD